MREPHSIRLLKLHELAAYKQLRDTMLSEHADAFTSDATAERRRSAESYASRLGFDRPEGGHFALGAWCGSALVGAVSCERDNRVKVRHIGHVTGMMVAAPARGCGIGAGLLAACITEARCAEGLELLTLTVTSGNHTAVRLYERAGFVRYGRLERALKIAGTYLDKDLMSLRL